MGLLAKVAKPQSGQGSFAYVPVRSLGPYWFSATHRLARSASYPRPFNGFAFLGRPTNGVSHERVE
jgi:hypothetical protein